jgi:hypothetical protein
VPAATKLEEGASVNTTEGTDAKVLAAMLPSLPASAIADALGNAGGDVQHAVDGLLKAGQVRVLIPKHTHINPDPIQSRHQLTRHFHHLHSRRHLLYPSTGALVAAVYFSGGRGSNQCSSSVGRNKSSRAKGGGGGGQEDSRSRGGSIEEDGGPTYAQHRTTTCGGKG